MTMAGKQRLVPIILFLSLFILSAIPISNSLPLRTKGRFIVDEITGHRVKLACVNWPSHVEVMLAEGLHEQPLRKLVYTLARLKFTCVRFTYATYMWTRNYDMTVEESFSRYNLTGEIAGIAKNNPSFLKMTLVEAYTAVVDELGRHGIMALLDNHVSKPTWCCSEDDGNGFFGDKYFNPDEWVLGLTKVAQHFKNRPQVIAISTRNELRGHLENPEDWHKYIKLGLSAIHKANPNVLLFASGTGYASDLTFLKKRPLGSNYDNKLVYDAHWYSWSGGSKAGWEVEFLNDACHTKTQNFINQTGFTPMLKEDPVPLFIGEFGLDQSLLSRADDHYLSCFLAYASHYDLDWGWWAWQGSYYFRQRKVGLEETFGIMTYHWNRIRSLEVQARLHLIKKPLLDPASKFPIHYVMFHPQSGACVHADNKLEIYTGNCNFMQRFEYGGSGSPIVLKGTDYCIQAVGVGQAPLLTTNCTSQLSSWKLLSSTNLHIAAMDEKGEYLCLEKESPSTTKIITSRCTFTLADPECMKDPQKDPTAQWFRLVKTNTL